ncbi:nicotinamide riboside transporter PnuC [Undibacterium pigrum]|uniref:Nicotinamide riboside transporter PnuC n=1 Tax=Undibacterium pigrum TaxID=401470 RepID=A0A318J4R6_9BURK|nr:nicotinamide riboside transporter PnuC [Undibacterium pigrum]PXX42104.1 nicotinamide mononucleotide transporter [Undibacterium pigrum]
MISALELSANAVTTASIILAGRNSVHTWWTGIIGSILFALVFGHALLYADVLLQLFFIITSITGWWQWQKGRNGTPLPISRAGKASYLWSVPVGLLATLAYGALLYYWTKAYAPFVDSAVLVFSIIAQILLMQRRMETWVFWLLVNTIAVPLYASRELYLTAFLYAAYWINAIVSWLAWRKNLNSDQSIAFVAEAR